MFRWLVQIYFYCTFNLLTISIPIERMLNGIYAVFESFLNDSENCALSITPRAAYICFKLFVEMSTLQLRQIWKVLEKLELDYKNSFKTCLKATVKNSIISTI